MGKCAETRGVEDIDEEVLVPHVGQHQGHRGGLDADAPFLLRQQGVCVAQLWCVFVCVCVCVCVCMCVCARGVNGWGFGIVM